MFKLNEKNKVVTECSQGKLELVLIDRARVILVKATETLLPVVYVLP